MVIAGESKKSSGEAARSCRADSVSCSGCACQQVGHRPVECQRRRRFTDNGDWSPPSLFD